MRRLIKFLMTLTVSRIKFKRHVQQLGDQWSPLFFLSHLTKQLRQQGDKDGVDRDDVAIRREP